VLVIGDLLDALYVGAFLFGLLFAGLSLLLGAGHLGGHVHLGGHGHGHGSFHGGHRAALPSGSGSHQGARREVVGPLSLSSVLVFLAWFGGIGYLARHGIGLAAPFSVLLGAAAGLIVGAAVSWVLAKVVAADARALDPEDYRLAGTLARVTSSIRAGGTGEIVYEQAGVRQVSAARTADGEAMPRGAEVVVLSCEHGIALVEPWAVFVGERHADLVSSTTDLPPPGGTERGRAT